jgi:hypothetical protein
MLDNGKLLKLRSMGFFNSMDAKNIKKNKDARQDC